MTSIHPMYRARSGLDDAALELLELGTYTILGTENPDGSVHVVPVMYLFEEGEVHIETSAATRKVRNIHARPRATILVQDHRADGTAWVSGSGPAELLRGAPAQRINRRIRARYLTDRGEERVGKVMSLYEDVTISVAPKRWMSWDMSALHATLATHGISLDEADEWYLSVTS